MSLITQGLGYDDPYDSPDPNGALNIPQFPKESPTPQGSLEVQPTNIKESPTPSEVQFG